jgi:hypothetical protein
MVVTGGLQEEIRLDRVSQLVVTAVWPGGGHNEL